MRDRITLSETASYFLTNVKQRLNLRGQDDYVPARIALGRSLKIDRTPTFKANIDDINKRFKNLNVTYKTKVYYIEWIHYHKV